MMKAIDKLRDIVSWPIAVGGYAIFLTGFFCGGICNQLQIYPEDDIEFSKVEDWVRKVIGAPFMMLCIPLIFCGGAVVLWADKLAVNVSHRSYLV